MNYNNLKEDMLDKFKIGEIYISKNGNRYRCLDICEPSQRILFKSLQPTPQTQNKDHKMAIHICQCKNFKREEND